MCSAGGNIISKTILYVSLISEAKEGPKLEFGSSHKKLIRRGPKPNILKIKPVSNDNNTFN